jgi:hypothetical protein
MGLARLVAGVLASAGAFCWAMVPASDAELAGVTGKDLVPNQQCCMPNSGETCSWTPPEGAAARCTFELEPGLCENPGGACYVVDTGPSGHDACVGTNDRSSACVLATDGWCVRYQIGTRVQLPYVCPCTNLGDFQFSGTRVYCVEGSTKCAVPG